MHFNYFTLKRVTYFTSNSLASWNEKYEETHASAKKLVCKKIFAQLEVMKAFMKTKENRQNICKFMNAWLRNC